MSNHCVDVLEADFDLVVGEASKTRPILIDFWAKWCQPCLKLKPLLEAAAEKAAGAFLLAKIDIDQNPNLAAAFRISSVPTLVVFLEGNPVNRYTGILTPPEIDAFMKPYLPGPAEEFLKKALEAITAGDEALALKLAQEAFAADETDDRARLFLVKCLLKPTSGQTDFPYIESLLEPFSETGPLAAEVLKLKGALFFAQCQPVSGIGADLYQKGCAKAATGATEEAIELFLEAGDLNDKLAKGPVKLALIQAFHLLGEGHPKLAAFRSSLMMLLT